MRAASAVLAVLLLAFSCDSERVYEKNFDFESMFWEITEQPVFEFKITDTVSTYNLYCNVRNSSSYPYSRLFVNAYLQDSSGNLLQKKLVEVYLFDQKTGRPLGESGIGDIFDQRVALLKNYQFPYAGKFSMKLEQDMRLDSLGGILAAGLRVEKSAPPPR